MKLVGLMLARNEDWIIGASLRVALEWCDEVVVLDHGSTDHTPDIISDVRRESPGRVTVLRETSDGWSEMRHRQITLEAARGRGATHCAIVDCDEILTANLLPQVRSMVKVLNPCGTLQVGMPCMWRSLTEYRIGKSIWSNRFDLTLAFADYPTLGWAQTDGYDHHSREPRGSRCQYRAYSASGGVMHLQFASWRRLTAKHSLYKIFEHVKYPEKSISEIDRLYSLALDESGLEISAAPADWWTGHERYREMIDLDASPWHEAECQRLLDKYGLETFEGLNLFGVVPVERV